MSQVEHFWDICHTICISSPCSFEGTKNGAFKCAVLIHGCSDTSQNKNVNEAKRGALLVDQIVKRVVGYAVLTHLKVQMRTRRKPCALHAGSTSRKPDNLPARHVVVGLNVHT